MTPAFEVGEIAIGQNFLIYNYRNGLECEVVDGLADREVILSHTGEKSRERTYLVLWSNGDRTAVEPRQLRKKRPPKSDNSTARQVILDCIERARMGQGATV